MCLLQLSSLRACSMVLSALSNAWSMRSKCRVPIQADKWRRDVTYDVGEQLLLHTNNVQWKSPATPKLMPRWMGPCKVLQGVGHVAYLLVMPASEKTHPMLYVSLLQPWRDNGGLQPPPPRFLRSAETVYTKANTHVITTFHA